MSRVSSNKIKIGVHWRNSVLSSTSLNNNSPRLPKLIELDPSVSLDEYITKICNDWKIPKSNLTRFALRYDDTHKFVTEQNRYQIPTGQVFYLSLSHEDEAQDILKLLAANDHLRQDSTALERLKLAAEDETFALEFVQQNGLQRLIKLFGFGEKSSRKKNLMKLFHSDENTTFTSNLLCSLVNLMANQRAIRWDDLELIDTIVDQLIASVNLSKISRIHASSSAMMILHSIMNDKSKHSMRIIQKLEITALFDYCNKHHDIETQYYALALINAMMSKGDRTLRSSLITAMSGPIVSLRLRELVQTIVASNEEHSNSDSSFSIETTTQSTRQLNRLSLIQQLCLLQRFYLNELYTNSMNKSPDRFDTKVRDMIAELRRSAFDTDLLPVGQSCLDLSKGVTLTTPTMNPRRAEALQRDYERLGFQDLREPIQDFQTVPPGILPLQHLVYFCTHQKNDFIRFVLENTCKTLQQQCPLVKSAVAVSIILCTLFHIGVEPKEFQTPEDYFLLFYMVPSFFEQTFVRCVLLFNKTWKAMRACDVDFQVVEAVVRQQISQSLLDICLSNPSMPTTNRPTAAPSYSPSMVLTPTSPTSTKSSAMSSSTPIGVQRFTFDYFCERLNANNYKDVCRRRDEQENKREETIMQLPIVEALKESLRPRVKSLTREARLKTMKKGQIFMTIESRPGAKKTKNRLMFWQLLDNEKSVQCSESPAIVKENNARDSSTTASTSLTRTMIPLENIKDVQCNIDQPRSGSATTQERVPKISRHSNAHASVNILLQNDTNYTLLCENDYDMSCWNDAFNILLQREMDSFYAREDMESLLHLQCQLQMLELDSPLISLPQHMLPVPTRLPPSRSVSPGYQTLNRSMLQRGS